MNMLLETKNNGKIWKITLRGNSWWCHFVHLYLHTQPHRLPTHKHPVSLKTAMEVAGIIKKLGHLLCMGHGSPSPSRRLGRLLTGGYQRHRTNMLGCKQSVAKPPRDNKGQQVSEAELRYNALASSLAAKNNYSELESYQRHSNHLYTVIIFLSI